MRNLISSIVALVLLVVSVHAQKFDHTIYEQYRIAPLKYSYPDLRLDYRMNHGATNDKFWRGDSIEKDYKDVSSDFQLKGHYYNYSESESRVRSIILYSSIGHYQRETENISDHEDYSNSIRRSFSYDYRYADNFYLGHNRWHWGVDGRLYGSTSNREQESESIRPTYSNYNDTRTMQGFQDHYLAVKVGYGRIRNVTGLHRAILMLDRLGEQGADVEKVTPEGVVQIAQVLDSEKKYSKLFYRSGKEY